MAFLASIPVPLQQTAAAHRAVKQKGDGAAGALSFPLLLLAVGWGVLVPAHAAAAAADVCNQ